MLVGVKLFVVVIFYVLGVIMQETIRLSMKGHPLTLLITSLALLFFFKVWMIRYNIFLLTFLVSMSHKSVFTFFY